jgi:hypothetical protein
MMVLQVPLVNPPQSEDKPTNSLTQPTQEAQLLEDSSLKGLLDLATPTIKFLMEEVALKLNHHSPTLATQDLLGTFLHQPATTNIFSYLINYSFHLIIITNIKYSISTYKLHLLIMANIILFIHKISLL